MTLITRFACRSLTRLLSHVVFLGAFWVRPSCSFVVIAPVAHIGKWQHSRFLATPVPQQEQQDETPRPPIVVVGTNEAAMGADMALNTFDILINQEQSAAQPISFLRVQDATSANLHEHLMDVSAQHGDIKPILHVIMEPGALPRAIMTSEITNNIAYLGIHISSSTELDTTFAGAGMAGKVSPELAVRCNENLKEALAWAGNTPTTMTLDLALHLALLQAHCLPKDKEALGDMYHVLLPEGGAIVVKYLYDEKAFGSGTDPLCCPTTEYLIKTPPISQSDEGANVAAAAYLALRSRGNNALDAACIAASVTAQLQLQPDNNTNLLQNMAQLARELRMKGVSDAPGTLRAKYKEFGYM